MISLTLEDLGRVTGGGIGGAINGAVAGHAFGQTAAGRQQWGDFGRKAGGFVGEAAGRAKAQQTWAGRHVPGVEAAAGAAGRRIGGSRGEAAASENAPVLSGATGFLHGLLP